MKIAVISGKGGTGKTTVSIAISELEKDSNKVDCDVDSPNMYLYYDGDNINKSKFFGSEIAKVASSLCIECGKCTDVCRFEAIKDGKVDPFMCEGCGACEIVCPTNAIRLQKEKTADMYITDTVNGKLSRSEMEIGSDGSGKLITELRRNIRDYEEDSKFTIVDGSPGIGCSVISSITGNDGVIIVTEPTKSGIEDFKRVSNLCKHFNIKTFVSINKFDINEDITKEIEEYCIDNDIDLVGNIPYDKTVMESINNLKPIIYYEESIANKAIRDMWNNVKKKIKN